MTVFNPTSTSLPYPLSNIFNVSDEQSGQKCDGFVTLMPSDTIYQQPRIFFEMHGDRVGYYMLFGALYARAISMMQEMGAASARLYTIVNEKEHDLRMFFEMNRFDMSATESIFELSIAKDAPPPMMPQGCTLATIPLNTQEYVYAFWQRLTQHIVMTYEQLLSFLRCQHVIAIGLLRNGQLVGEAMATVANGNAYLIVIYVDQRLRRNGYGQLLLDAITSQLALEKFEAMHIVTFTDNIPFCKFLDKNHARSVKVQNFCPGMAL